MRASLDIRSGPQAGKIISLESGRTVQVGRSSQADVSLPDDQKLSRLPFALVCDAESCTIRDLDSRNGILVNNFKVKEASLHDGDVVLAEIDAKSCWDRVIDRKINEGCNG